MSQSDSAEANRSARTVQTPENLVSCWPLIGRERELEVFAQVLANRRGGRGFVLSGPAGVGKSRLAEECLAQAVRAGFRGGRATASAAAAAVPLGAIAHLLPAGVDLSDPVAGFAAVAAALSGPNRRRWAVLVDDLHLLDATSVMLLRQLMDAGLIRLIATIRSGEVTSDAVRALAHGDTVHHIELAAFDQAQVETVLQAALGGPVGPHTVRLLHDMSGGNALYLRELVHGALATGALASDGQAWQLTQGSQLPGTTLLTDLIGAHLATAGPPARPVLELLALCGPLPLAEAQAAASRQVLADLERAGLILSHQDGRRTRVMLAHPLYGEVMRASLPVLHRQSILLDQAQRVEAHGALRRGDALCIATWRLAATSTADPAVLIQAAAAARNAHDYPQTVTLLEALPEPRHNAQTRLLLGEALSQMGRWKQADVVLAEAEVSTADEQEKLAVALARTANLAWSNTDLTQALTANDTALSQASSLTDRRTLRANEGFLRIAAGQPARGLALLEDLETKPGHIRNVRAWLRGSLAKPTALALTGHTQQAIAWAERAHTVHLQLDDHTLLPHPAIQRIPLVLALTETGRLADARITAENAYARLTDSSVIARAWMALFLGRTQWLAGHLTSARRWYAEAAALARTINHAKALRPALAGLAACAAVLGDLDAAETALDEHSTTPPAPGFLPAAEEHLGPAWLLAARGHLAQARTVLAKAARAARTAGHPTSEALLLTDIARLGGAQEMANRLTDLAQACDGTFIQARARLATALAEDDPVRLLHVADELEELGADLLAAEAATTAAAAWHRAGEPRRATAATRHAVPAATRCQSARTPLLTTPAAAAPLTPREREIALLATTNTTSKDIAEALRLSVRTVENHLQHAYSKLGVTTRRELAITLGTGRVSDVALPRFS
ncbi:LuxR C-terminal-related transcriptional regulator [Streptomyces sp. NPDC096153]|uniref:LuxR C-terminal-related transcriptional regulator n=1 Tax=Streptomyces sp. NPDC096153 TaxID=3155548 RepID=UPI0033292813